MVELTPTRVEDAVGQSLLAEYFSYRAAVFPGPARYRLASPDPAAFGGDGLFIVASVDRVPSGCGGARALSPLRFEIKHLYVRPASRGLGIGRAILSGLEDHARLRGARELVLDTHSSLTAAASLYGAAGYESIDAYNDNPNANVWYRKLVR
mgnify:CR=1 FL=1